MRVAILTPKFLPYWVAGTELATYHLAKELAKKGHQLHVVTSLDFDLPTLQYEQGFFIHRVKFQQLRFFGVLLFWINTLITLIKIHPDIIHIQGACYPSGFIAAKLLQKPYIICGQGNDIYFPPTYLKPLIKFEIMDANAMVALTKDMKHAMQKYFNREIHVIPNGVDLTRFNVSHASVFENKSLDDKKQRIIFVGRFRPEKGVTYLIEAVSLIKKEVPIELMLIGEGPQEIDLKIKVKQLNLNECVSFLGKIPNALIPEYLAKASVFVLPSLSEGFPLVVLEAMASGLPIVATKIRGLSEIIHDEINGFLVDPGLPETLSKRILQLLENKPLRESISANNLIAAQNYSWSNVATRLIDLYGTLI